MSSFLHYSLSEKATSWSFYITTPSDVIIGSLSPGLNFQNKLGKSKGPELQIQGAGKKSP